MELNISLLCFAVEPLVCIESASVWSTSASFWLLGILQCTQSFSPPVMSVCGNRLHN